MVLKLNKKWIVQIANWVANFIILCWRKSTLFMEMDKSIASISLHFIAHGLNRGL